jgi:hypothetical protein
VDKIDPTGPVGRYRQLAGILRERIEAGPKALHRTGPQQPGSCSRSGLATCASVPAAGGHTRVTRTAGTLALHGRRVGLDRRINSG